MLARDRQLSFPQLEPVLTQRLVLPVLGQVGASALLKCGGLTLRAVRRDGAALPQRDHPHHAVPIILALVHAKEDEQFVDSSTGSSRQT